MDIQEKEGPESVAERIRRLRLDRGLSQRELAGPGLSPSYISRVEAGDRTPSLKALRALANKLGVSPEYLETGTAVRPAEEREVRLADAELALRLGDDLPAAESVLRELLEEARSESDVGVAQRAEVALGLAAAQAGRHAEAIRALEGPVSQGWFSPASRPDVHLELGASYAASGRYERAIELYEASLVELDKEAPADTATRIRFLTYLSYVYADRGEFARARETLAELGETTFLTDPYSRVRIYWSLARLASMEGETHNALAYLRRAIALLESTEDTHHQARAHLLCSEIMLVGGQGEEAGPHLERAEQLFELGGSARDLGSVRTLQAKQAAMLKDAGTALACAEAALDYLDEYPVERASALHARALAYAVDGDIARSETDFALAVETLSESGEWREAVQACQAWADVVREAGRNDEAFAILTRATGLAMRTTPSVYASPKSTV